MIMNDRDQHDPDRAYYNENMDKKMVMICDDDDNNDDEYEW